MRRVGTVRTASCPAQRTGEGGRAIGGDLLRRAEAFAAGLDAAGQVALLRSYCSRRLVEWSQPVDKEFFVFEGILVKEERLKRKIEETRKRD